MNPIWIVDDDQSIRFVLEKALMREELPTRSFTNAKEVLTALESCSPEQIPQVMVSDIRMPGATGLELLSAVKAKFPALPVIIMTAYSDLDSAVSSFQGGAFEYLPKPFDLPKAIELIRRALEESKREQGSAFEAKLSTEMLGQAPAMQDVFRAIGRLSQSVVTVMITGESGSGKELVARALHKHSVRAGGPFVAINTAAIPKDLLESELFGHERGAFTGAQTMRRGRFEQAEGGTLFLDEIGDMPLDLQTRLLRVLSDGNFYRVGGHVALKANVRVIAATHQDLEQRVKDGVFREDLYHRLNVIRLRLPALRERVEDIPMLTHHFLQQSAQQLGVEYKRISDSAIEVLQMFSFPGNVRQLENICHWLTVMAPAQNIEPKDLPPEVLAQVGISAVDLTQSSKVSEAAYLAPHSEYLSAQHNEGEGYADRALNEALDGAAYDELNSERPVGGVQRPTQGPQFAGVDQGVRSAPSAGYAQSASNVSASNPNLSSNFGADWQSGLEAQAMSLLVAGHQDVWDILCRKFESTLIQTALANTRGRRIEAAQKLGIGRNTITRKIQELGLE